MRLYEIEGFGSSLNEEMLMEGWLDSVKKALGDKVSQGVTAVNNTIAALQVFYKIGTNPQYLESATFLLKKGIKNKLKYLDGGQATTALKNAVIKAYPQGRGLVDFIKGCMIEAVLQAYGKISDTVSSAKNMTKDGLDQAKDKIFDWAKDMSGLDSMISSMTGANAIFMILRGMGIASDLLFSTLSTINQKIGSIAVNPNSQSTDQTQTA